ncbi:hypothetical protein SynBIOSE41_03749 [Synechococcus sp. BIOS-E4-1]|nr:hypothetical protein SynBIOSE41_03749 [Synechococcus sp. BIOS-E4-1]
MNERLITNMQRPDLNHKPLALCSWVVDGEATAFSFQVVH